jgi:hypothetical protein
LAISNVSRGGVMRLSTGVLYCLVTAGLAATSGAWAQEKIGVAVIVRNDVNGVLSSRTVPITAGEDVFGKEIVKTGSQSSAKLVFADSTNLAVGPNSSVTLDKFVFSGPTDYKKAAMTLIRGAFRFTTGTSDKRAYEIKTGVATLSVRGTVGDILARNRETTVTVLSGKILACTAMSYRCRMVLAGETVTITSNSATKETANGLKAFSFERICAADPPVCEVTPYQNAANAVPPDLTPYAVGAAALGAVGGGIAAAGRGASSPPFIFPRFAPASP